MDLLSKRYSSPFLILDEMIAQGQFYEFVIEVNKIQHEEELWDIWTHKIFDKGFEEWKKTLNIPQEVEKSDFNAKATIKNSMDILNGFNPE